MNPFYTVLIIAAVVVTADALRHWTRWWDRRRARLAAASLKGHTIDAAPLLRRLVEVRAGHVVEGRLRKMGDRKRRLRLVAEARRAIGRFSFFRSARGKSADTVGG